jgi:signal transduction histidine kinase
MYKTFHTNSDAIGLGLFMTKNKINVLGGTIKVESKINEGSSFKITL